TLVGATTRSGALTGPLRDRFGFTAHMDFYSDAELAHIVSRSAEILGTRVARDAAVEIAGRSRGTPRIANRLLRRVRDYAEVRADGVVTVPVARSALEVYEVDELGLDRLDRARGWPVDVSPRRRPGNSWASPGPTVPVGSRPSGWTWAGDPGHAAEPGPGILGTDRSVTGARRSGPEVADPKRKGPHGTGN